ncbi:MAG: hypothetical protein L0191_03885, partial [Acidobacteria bacterium]|nr:hypothetical protein [Acidobacteriota bacterium]
NQARESLQTMVLQARREADQKLESRPVLASESELEAVLEQELGAQLKNLAAAVAGQLKTARDQMLAQTGQELEGLLAQAREQQEEAAARQAGQQAALEARVEATLRARDYVESLARTLPQIVDQRAQEAVTAFDRLAHDRLEEQFSGRRLEQRLAEAAEPAASELRQKLFEDFDRHEREFLDRVSVRVEEAVAAAARAREHTGQWRSEMAGALEQALADSRCRFEEMMAGREQQAQSVLHKIAEQTGRAEAATERLGKLLASLQEERRSLEGQNQELRRQRDEIKAWLAQESEEVRRVVRGEVAEARGEIRGRLHQGVDTLQDLLESRCRESAARMEERAARQAGELAEKVEQARERLLTLQDETQRSIALRLHEKLAEILGRFQQETDKLAQDAIVQCQADMRQSLDSLKLL